MGGTAAKLRQNDIDTMLTTTAFSEQELRRLFVKFEQLGTGERQISPDRARLKPLVLRLYNMFGSPETHFADFVAALSILSDISPASEDAKLRFAFQVFDEDRDGYISNAELFRVLQLILQDIPDTDLQQVVDRTILQANRSGDGRISYDEFKQMLLKNCTDIAEKLTITWQ
ncbi:protein phosphatase 2B [Pelomyxa schiedti]|nr:protein phosphatase 2B [Pelomyxa schiedti]